METQPESMADVQIPSSAKVSGREPYHAMPSTQNNARMPDRAASKEERHAIIEEHIAWMKANSPGWETADPFAIDWQAVKSEGRNC